MLDSDYPFEEDVNSSTEFITDDYHDFFWEIQDWSDESNEFYNTIDFSNSSIYFSFQRDNKVQFKVSVCGCTKNKNQESFKIRLILLNQGNQLDISKTFDISLSQQYDDPQEIAFPIKQSEMGERGFISNDRIRIQIQIKSKTIDNIFSSSTMSNLNDSHFFIQTDSIFDQSKSDTNIEYTGLKNQGATCYMNSLLQSLFHLPCFRKTVFEMEEKSDIPTPTNIVHNLKLLFAQMQFQMNQPINVPRESVSTTALTTSFGWTYENTFTQQDVQEFCRVLLDKLEDKMKGTKKADRIKKIFSGEYQTYTKGINIDFENKVNNEFYDLSLEVKNCEDIYQSFEKYVEEQILNGDNQYNSEKYGKQDALVGIKFVRFPRVLHLHLKRFEIDQENNRSIKINSPLKFYKTIDLSKYLIEKSIEIIEVDESESENENDFDSLFSNNDDSKSAIFDLFGVLVHSGSSLSGHFYAYLRPNLGDKWFIFNDSLVKESSEKEAIENNFGSESSSFSAYMLIYTKRSEQKDLFKTVDNDSIPPEIVDEYFQLIEKEKQIEKSQFEFKNESNDSINIFLFTEKTTLIHNSFKNKLSFDFNKNKSLSFSLKKSDTNYNLYSKVCELYSVPIEKVELWKLTSSGLNYLIRKDNDSLSQMFLNNLNVFVFINNYEGVQEEKSQEENDKQIHSIFSQSSSIVFPQEFDDDFAYDIIESKEEDDPFSFLNQTEIPVFVFAYCPFNSPKFIFLYSIKADRNQKIMDFIDSRTKSIFGIESDSEDDDQDFNTYFLNEGKLNRVKSKQDTFYSVNCDSGGIFVIECKDSDEIYLEIIQKAVEKNGYDTEIKEKVNEDDDDEVVELNLSEKGENKIDQKAVNFLDVMSVENINASKYYSFLNDFNLIEVCSVIETKTVKYPNLIQFGEFCRFLCAIFNIGSFVILFREGQIRMINEDEKNVMSSIISPLEKKITAMFLDGSIVNDQNEIEINGEFIPFENVIRFLVDISFDGVRKSMSTEILIPDFFSVSEIFKIVKEKGMIENFQIEKTRILEIVNGRIRSILKIDEPILFLSEQIRIEKVPDDQIDIEIDRFIRISFDKEIGHDPFLFYLSEEILTVQEIKEAVRNLINETESEFQSYDLKFFDEKFQEIKETINDQTKIREIEPKIEEILFFKKMQIKPIYDRSVHIYN